jgi:hypothetical protein
MTDLPKSLSSLNQNLDAIVEQAVLKFPIKSRKWSTFQIPKRSGQPREITAPKKELKQIQAQLADHIANTQAFSKAVHGFVPNKGVKSAAEEITGWLTLQPVNRRKRLKYVSIDMKDFFTTCKASRVRKAYRDMFPGWSRKAIEKASWLSTRHCVLPQGSPVSPILTNVLARKLDRQLTLIAKARKGIYIRYADDIFMIVESATGIESTIKKAITNSEFVLNEAKTRIGRITSNSGFELLGLRIHADQIMVKCTPRRKVRRRLRAAAMAPRSASIDPKLAKCIALGCMYYHIGHTFAKRLRTIRGSGSSIVNMKLKTGVTDTNKILKSLH